MHNAIKLVLIGLATGVFGGLFGIGGGVLMVPALVFLMGFDQRRAVGTTPIAMLPAATAGLISYALQGGFDWRAAIALSIGVIVGAQIGLRLLDKLSLRALEIGFFVFLLLSIVSLWVVVPSRDDTINMTPLVFVLLLVFGLIPGLAMSLLGVGGGIIAIPVLMVGFNASDIIAKGTSLCMVITGAITSASKNIRKGNADIKAGAILGVSAALVSPFSVQLAVLLSPQVANILFSLFLAFVASQYLVRILKQRKTAAK